MKSGYPCSVKGGVSQQAHEAVERTQRSGIQILLRHSGVKFDLLKRVVDLGSRNGDTTLGLVEVLPKHVRVVGVEEVLDAALIAKVKFGHDLSTAELARVAPLIEQLPAQWLKSITSDAASYKDRVSFHSMPFTSLSKTNGDSVGKSDLIIGHQVLHWLDCNSEGLPLGSLLNSIRESLSVGGVFVGSTSTAFMAIDSNQQVDGMVKSQYSFDNHPFVQLVYKIAERLVREITGSIPTPILDHPPLSVEKLTRSFTKGGFGSTRFDAFLVPVPLDAVKLRLAHQGRLNGVPEDARAELIIAIMDEANGESTLLAHHGQDPRLHKGNLYDLVPFVIAKP